MEPSKSKGGSRRRGGSGGQSRTRRRRSASPSKPSRSDTRQRGPPPSQPRSFSDNHQYPPPPPSIPAPPPPPVPTGGFSALSGRRDADSYRPRQASDRDRDRDRRSGGGYPPPQGQGGDSYRPNIRPPQSDFTFSVPGPPGLLPFPPPRPFEGRSRGNFRGRRGRVRYLASDRPILTASNDSTPLVFLREGDEGAKYKSIDDLSDDEEHEMDMSDSDNSDPAEPALKRSKPNQTPSKSDDSVPKWSNPDPYTALPPPDPTQRKKTDVVQLIRKARVEAEDGKDEAAPALDEFISFDADSEDEAEKAREDQKAKDAEKAREADAWPPRRDADRGRDSDAWPPRRDADNSRDADTWPPRRGYTDDNGRRSDPLGSRKRTADDEIKPPPPGPIKRKVSNMTLKGNLSSEWLPAPGQDPCPWATVDHSATAEMGAWLHKEIIDFYEHFRPRKFEQAMRQALVDSLNKALRRNPNFRGCEVKAFGSFMSGLYLPMADMDLVICSESLLKQSWVTQRLCSKSSLYRFRAFLQNENIPTRETVQVIAGARVPLVKYVDRATGLKVDISFENIGGVKAIDRFITWRRQYPAMPILVTIIKQYLSMRGLNEPVNGGIGGFSVICLVVSMLQLMPQVQSGDMIPEHHLGELLMEFFDLYGNRFQYEDVAIRLNPPGYVPKSQVNTFPYKAMDRLSIIDPNNVNNDVSGGSYNYESVTRGFRQGFETLKKRLAELAGQSPKERTDASVLEAILGGNYDNFERQREYLRQLSEKTIGNCDDSPHVC